MNKICEQNNIFDYSNIAGENGNLPPKRMIVCSNYVLTSEVLVAIIEAIVEQFHLENITVNTFKEAIHDLVFLYGATIFPDIPKRTYEEEIIELLDRDIINYIDIFMTDLLLIPINDCNRPIKEQYIIVDDEPTLNLDIVITILEVVTEQYEFKVINSYEYKDIIVDLCGFYGMFIFDELETKHYSKNIVDKIDNDILIYIDICIADFKLITSSDYIYLRTESIQKQNRFCIKE